MTFTAADIKTLRDKTGAGMMDCKKALSETNGNIESAIEWLRKNGINTAQKKSSRSASDGLINVNIDGSTGVILEINAETDFVARNENFQKFCDGISKTCIDKKIDNLEDLLIAEFCDTKRIVKDELTDLIAKLGENIVVKKLKLISTENLFLQKYVHNAISESCGKIGVMLTFSCKKFDENVKEFSKQICMHVAATDPKSMTIDKLNKELVEKERTIYSEQLKSTGKPPEILEKIINGKVNKFYEEVCLLEQIFVIDNKTKVKNCIEEFNKNNNLDFSIDNYFIFKLGQD